MAGEKITLDGVAVSVGLGAAVGYVGGSGWTSVAMGGKLLLQDVALNVEKNFLQFVAMYIPRRDMVKSFMANIFAGVLGGIYSRIIYN